MSARQKNHHRLVYPIILIAALTLTCNMPGWGGDPTETASPTPDASLRSTEEPEILPSPEAEVPTSGGGGSEMSIDLQRCDPLPPPEGPSIIVSTESDLRDRASDAASGTTILIEPGVYNLGDSIHIVNDGLTLRSSTGNRADVVLDGGGMLTGHTNVILIEADDVTIADLTIRNGGEHGVSINGSDRPMLYNLHIYDTGYQLVKVNPVGDGSHDGTLACSFLEYTTTSPEEYTNGISAHDAHNWSVRDNQWYRIRTPGNTPAPTILFWSGSSDTVVERNLLVDCYQGIAFGNASHGGGDHTGGIVRNNFIYASLPHDSVIEMVHATGWLVAHNTALLLNPNGVTWGMEARFEDTSGTFAYNLTNMDIWGDRDSAQAALNGNMINLDAGWLRDPTGGDLHLIYQDVPPVDAASPLPEVPTDIDGELRPPDGSPDVGADEYSRNVVYIPLIP
jgi:hypothetical protein